MPLSSDPEEPIFDFRTSNARFQQRLLEAQQVATEEQIQDDIAHFYSKTWPENANPLEAEKAELKIQLRRINDKNDILEKELEQQKARRIKEASLSKMTPEERAKAVEEEIEEPIDEDVVFEYMLYIGGAPLPTNPGDMSGSDFVSPHAELREKALQDPEVQKQGEFTHLHFKETNNYLISNPDGSGEIRQCKLKGTTYDQWFNVSFDVYEPDLVVDNFSFDLAIETQVNIGSILQQIKDEGDVLSFFRLLVHYGELENERSKFFDKLKERITNGPITLEELGVDQLKFLGPRDDDPELIFSWKLLAKESNRNDLGVNVCELVVPDISLEMDPSKAWEEKDRIDILKDMPLHFARLVETNGMMVATEVMLEVVFDVPGINITSTR
ncbi:hypothetical protein F4703DRAFT_1822090 [Phycomyces blakesleeanus]|uniref:Uncharacterized protein n=1 Tax=Phycomyces blakesleeanus (strain ATCC 8743b / DSM 1359 / FGSC 10004 / NBRC 33097 / NRRL 1555) TaxID=763407 RepID=A0A162YDM4_PHYB8|nr:hypothetical protein PHYBLDRAFT_59114 [Phycomyces blakesleeanus NRRL 1555(-)]OAD80075.1 hypothetical protein PHYBLDRAFT_59114 [Phycomyces blakesleeanus NRRL 1555(-)]|eukprot:XP_018298115.1 hypothetical protein PHYBLDRAFT_59114 [Phycomyces blakesleeanus NRRL 1555(-)]